MGKRHRAACGREILHSGHVSIRSTREPPAGGTHARYRKPGRSVEAESHRRGSGPSAFLRAFWPDPGLDHAETPGRDGPTGSGARILTDSQIAGDGGVSCRRPLWLKAMDLAATAVAAGTAAVDMAAARVLGVVRAGVGTAAGTESEGTTGLSLVGRPNTKSGVKGSFITRPGSPRTVRSRRPRPRGSSPGSVRRPPGIIGPGDRMVGPRAPAELSRAGGVFVLEAEAMRMILSGSAAERRPRGPS